MLEAYSKAKTTLLHSLKEKILAMLWWARLATLFQPVVWWCSICPEKGDTKGRKETYSPHRILGCRVSTSSKEPVTSCTQPGFSA